MLWSTACSLPPFCLWLAPKLRTQWWWNFVSGSVAGAAEKFWVKVQLYQDDLGYKVDIHQRLSGPKEKILQHFPHPGCLNNLNATDWRLIYKRDESKSGWDRWRKAVSGVPRVQSEQHWLIIIISLFVWFSAFHSMISLVMPIQYHSIYIKVGPSKWANRTTTK